MSEQTQGPGGAGDDDRCASVHWSLPVQCVLKVSHRENWHEAWHPTTGNRMRYRYPARLTEELHHGEWHRLDLPQSAERAHAYKMGGPGREYLVDALAAQLHHSESLHLHTLPGDEGDACRYCYLRAGRSVGALAPAVEPELITTAEQIRALPVGTVLLDSGQPAPNAWRIAAEHWIERTGHPNSFNLRNVSAMDSLLAFAPFRVLYTPVVPDGR